MICSRFNKAFLLLSLSLSLSLSVFLLSVGIPSAERKKENLDRRRVWPVFFKCLGFWTFFREKEKKDKKLKSAQNDDSFFVRGTTRNGVDITIKKGTSVCFSLSLSLSLIRVIVILIFCARSRSNTNTNTNTNRRENDGIDDDT